MYCGFIAAICIAMFVRASLAASPEAPLPATRTPILPPPWIYEATTSAETFSNLLTDIFSPILRILSSRSAFMSRIETTSSPSPALSTSTVSALSATACTNSWNTSFLATKSVSELTSTTTAVFPSIATFAIPSAAILAAFFSALAAPLFLSTSTAASISPLVSVSAFLQSIIPAPVSSLNSFTMLAVIAIVITSK